MPAQAAPAAAPETAPPEPLLDPATEERLALARAGKDLSVLLPMGSLEPGQVGIVAGRIAALGTVRAYTRKRGGEGLLCRLTLADATGQVDLVLWDSETRLVAQLPLSKGTAIRIRGPAVRAGWRGGVELALAGARLEAAGPTAATGPAARVRLEGFLVEVGAARVVGEPPAVRFNADATLAVADGNGEVRVVAWDEALRALRGLLPGAPVAIEGALPHPELEGWYIADAPATVRQAHGLPRRNG